MDTYFEKWFREEDSLNAFTNSKLTLQRFKDFKLKLDVWDKSAKNREKIKKSHQRRNQKIRDLLEQAKRQFTFENEYIQKCICLFDNI